MKWLKIESFLFPWFKKIDKEEKEIKSYQTKTTLKSLFPLPRSIGTMGYPKPTASPINPLKQLIQTWLWIQNKYFWMEESLFEWAPFKPCQVQTGFLTEGALSKTQLIRAHNCSAWASSLPVTMLQGFQSISDNSEPQEGKLAKTGQLISQASSSRTANLP